LITITAAAAAFLAGKAIDRHAATVLVVIGAGLFVATAAVALTAYIPRPIVVSALASYRDKLDRLAALGDADLDRALRELHRDLARAFLESAEYNRRALAPMSGVFVMACYLPSFRCPIGSRSSPARSRVVNGIR
jgi:hypothetical protein